MAAVEDSPVWMDPGTNAASSSLMHFSTDMFAPHERISAWREAYGQSIAQLDIEPVSEGPFTAQATLCSLPDLNIVETETGKINWRCTVHSDDVILVTSEAGVWSCTERGQDVMLTPGQATILLNGETTTGTTIGRRSMVRIPIKSIAPMVGNVTAKLERKFPPDATLLRLLSPYISLMRSGDVRPELQRTAVAHVHDIFAMMIGPTRDGAELARERGVRAARFKAIKDDIGRNLSGDISVGMIALRHQVTPRYIQMLFENDGTTFTEFVREQRLACAYRMLKESRRGHEKVSTIAFDCGFSDLSYFHRVFRQRYGASPADVRAQARTN